METIRPAAKILHGILGITSTGTTKSGKVKNIKFDHHVLYRVFMRYKFRY